MYIYVKGRLAADNALVGLEMLHHIHRSRSNPISIKLDLSKAFDRVEWNLILYVMRRMNFPKSFIQIINQCISTTNIAICFNGTKTSYLKPTMGLRQGDSLSLFLFILCMESLTALINQASTYRW